ncbi:MAG: DUF975 family protein [Carnobacterium inhibens]|uniref:DUF975 family protein n=1 Tax=Carnobacterium sp. TaxID=48221 RepID=UPI003314C96D
MKRREIKKTAKKLLKGNWKVAILNLIIISVLTSVISQGILTVIGAGSSFTMIESVIEGNVYDSTVMAEPTITASLLSLLISTLVGLISSLMYAGYAWNILDRIDGAKLSIEGMFQTFRKERIFKTTGLIIVMSILIMLWSLLFIIPGIIKSYSYSQALNIMRDNPTISIMDALDQSRKMMKGKKWSFFLLQLSFIWLYIVPFLVYALILFGSVQTIEARLDAGPNEGIAIIIGFLLLFLVFVFLALVLSFYIEPYRRTAQQVFYRTLTDGDTFDPFHPDYHEKDNQDEKYNEDYEGRQLDDVDF